MAPELALLTTGLKGALFVCVCVCFWLREREKKKKKELERKLTSLVDISQPPALQKSTLFEEWHQSSGDPPPDPGPATQEDAQGVGIHTFPVFHPEEQPHGSTWVIMCVCGGGGGGKKRHQ